jgi:glutathione-independent formaldehyde dehydrogenase
MRAVVYRKPFEVAVEEVPDPRIEQPNDVIVRITSTCICGSDLHMYEGRTAAEPGIVFGHENLGIIEEVGSGVTSLEQGDRVVMPFNVACGFCKNCLGGYTGFCLTVNPGFAGGAYGYVAMGPYPGGQAEYLRVPYADLTACRFRRAPSTSPTTRCSPTISPPATTAASSRASRRGRPSRSTAPGRSA